MSNLHRIKWIDARIRAGAYPNARTIAERFEISTRQAARDIEYLRYSLGAPLEYSAEKNGYYYAVAGFILPALIISEEEKKALEYLSSQYRSLGSQPAVKIAELFSRLTSVDETQGDVPPGPARNRKGEDGGRESFPVIELDPHTIETYLTLERSIRNRTKVEISYVNRKNEASLRTFAPYKLFSKGRRRYVVGFCEMRNEIRVFAITRFRKVRKLSEVYEVSPLFRAEEYAAEVPFQFREPYTAVIEDLNSSIPARLFSEHSRLKVTPLEPKGRYRMDFFSSDNLIAFLLSKRIDGFRILSPRWLKERLRRRLERIFRNNFEL